jgi:hypothetical protein
MRVVAGVDFLSPVSLWCTNFETASTDCSKIFAAREGHNLMAGPCEHAGVVATDPAHPDDGNSFLTHRDGL